MAYVSIASTSIASGKPLTTTIMNNIKDNEDHLYGTVGSMAAISVPNGSFEIDSDSDGTPDNWSPTAYTGGSYALYATAPAHGAKSWSFTHPGGAGNGGGYIDSDYIEVSEYIQIDLYFTLWATAAGAKNIVQIIEYDKDKAELGGSPVTLYSSTTNPTSATPYCIGFVPLTTCKYFKVRLIGGYTDTDVAATIYFDDVRVEVAKLAKTGDYEYQWMPRAASTTSISYVSLAEFRPGRAGVYSCRLGISKNTTVNLITRAKIYRNGTAVGTERTASGVGNTAFSYYNEDITLVSSTDLVQIYAMAPGAGVSAVVKFGLRTGNLGGYKAIAGGAYSFIDAQTT